MIKFPGLIDPHVHLRDPGQTEKEDFYSGTSAALAGGFTTVLDMPNNQDPIITRSLLEQKISVAKKKTVCNIGFYFGSLGNNSNEFESVKDRVYGLKLYLDFTTGGYIVTPQKTRELYVKWNEAVKGEKPILLHAEEDVIDEVLLIVEETKQPTHICHVSSEEELTKIINAKMEGLPITCGVCPHHLFLNEADVKRLGAFALMKPPLKSKADVEFLWKHFKDIDIVESDHAPHTINEKKSGNPPFGVPGLETTLPLLLTAMNKGRITQEDIIDKCHTQPKKIFRVSDQPDTYIDVDENIQYEIRDELLFTKCKWSPFTGKQIMGKVMKTVIGGKTVYDHGVVKAEQGSGTVI